MNIFDNDFVRDVRALDPLECDQYCYRLPDINERKDTAEIINILEKLIPTSEDINSFSFIECIAVVRDLGIFIGSLRRHGIEVAEVLPAIVSPLIMLSNTTKMVPRDTIFHYTLWNPRDNRRRVYTASPQEFHLQESVCMVFPETSDCINMMDLLTEKPSIDEEFSTRMKSIEEKIRVYENSMIYVQENVSPKYFIDELRPYLDDVEINGQKYLGPAAAQLPLWLMDLFFWGGGEQGTYGKFWQQLVPYSPVEWRTLAEKLKGKMAMVDKIANELKSDNGNIYLQQSSISLNSILTSLYKFRSKHLGIAKKSYKSSDSYTIGSAGGSISLLTDLLTVTEKLRNSVNVKV